MTGSELWGNITLGNTALHLQEQSLLSKTITIHFSLVLRSFPMISPVPYFIQKYGVSPVRHYFWSFLCIQERTIIQHRVYSHWFSFSCRGSALSTTSVSIPALFQEIKHRSKIAATQLNWLSGHLQESDCLPVEWIISWTSLGNVAFQPAIKLLLLIF